ncbi:MAG: hypothetical protein IPN95_29625 [Bacteroidetes bacterium]|nr:hypothetical protein [Bacteroidota bacterium]MBL0016231.1 hypothetical protein [Bacteroidota bacterium]
MKSKILFPSLLFVLAVLIGSSCNPGGSASSTGNGDKVQLELAVTPGLVYKQVTKTDQTSTQKMMGISTKTSQATEMYLKNEVLSVGADGLADVKCTYERIKVESDNSMMGKKTFDSDNAPADVAMEFRGYTALVGKSIGFKIDKYGTVQEVYGVDSLFDIMMQSVSGEAGGMEMEAVKTAMKSTFGDEAMKSMMQSASIQYPDVLIAEGDTWGKKISSMGAMPLAMDVTYKVDHIDAEKVVLSFEGTITTDKSKGLDLGLMEMSMDLKGDYSGTSEIDRKTGLVLKSTIDQDMSGSMGAMGMNLPVTIEQKVTVERY